MASYKLANYIILRRNFAARNKYSTCLLVSDRNYCSKDSKTEIENASSAEEKSSKQEDKLHEKSAEADSSSKESDSDSSTKAAAKQKLMSLLSSIKIVTDKSAKASNLNLAKPVKRISKKERLRQMEEQMITPEKKMDMAVKAVASSFKEDSEKIETELSAKLSALKLTKPLPQDETEDVDDDDSDLNSEVNKKIMSSVEKVADTISDSPIPARSELTKRLMMLSTEQKLDSEKKSMRSVIKGMTIQPQKTAVQTKTVEPPKPIKKMPPKKISKVNLFGFSPLNIFNSDAEVKEDSSNKFWKELEERELRLLTQFGPANAFEEMIMWTEQGKHWKFPIDNETEMGEEDKVGFHEHVFLEHHLKGFPTKGPVRQFMELVVVGMSKNPYLTVERKLDHIEWFRNYFKGKEDILREEGAIE